VIPVNSIRAGIKGRLIESVDLDYDTAGAVLVGGIDRRPSLILRPADAADVAAAIGLARDNRLEVEVRSGRHSATGFGSRPAGLILGFSAANKGR
jgi:FAD/FMN-containing dehydrogenase